MRRLNVDLSNFNWPTWEGLKHPFYRGKIIFSNYTAIRNIKHFSYYEQNFSRRLYNVSVLEAFRALPEGLNDHSCWFANEHRDLIFTTQPYAYGDVQKVKDKVLASPKFMAICIANDIKFSIIKLDESMCGWHAYGTILLELAPIRNRQSYEFEYLRPKRQIKEEPVFYGSLQFDCHMCSPCEKE